MMELFGVDDVFGEVLGECNRHLNNSGTKRGKSVKLKAFYCFFSLVNTEQYFVMSFERSQPAFTKKKKN